MSYIIPASIHTSYLLVGSGGSVSSYTVDSGGDHVNKKLKDRKKELARESTRLVHRLEARPYDVRSLHQLAAVDYQREDYESTIKVINKLIKLNEHTPEMLLLLGKCYFRRWVKDTEESDLLLALGAYKTAVENPAMAQHKSPTPWFEMVSILLRLGRYQAALDVFGIVLTLFKAKQYEDWIILTQYNIAQIMLLAGKVTEAYSIYQELLLYTSDISVTDRLESDALILLPTRMLHGILLVEMGRLTQLLGRNELAIAVYRENWLSLSYAFKFGALTLETWLNDPEIFKGIALLFRKEYNYFMAAAYYGKGAEFLSEMYCPTKTTAKSSNNASGSNTNSNTNKSKSTGKNNSNLKNDDWNYIPYHIQQEIIENVLIRAELLAEVHSFAQAEFCAHFAVSRANGDLIVMARAGRCCRKDLSSNKELVDSSTAIIAAVMRIQWALKSVFWRIKNKLKRRRIAKATKLVAFVRMCVVRNRMISARLTATSAKRIVFVAQHLYKVAFKTGKRVIDDFFVIWNAASKMIQRMIGNWLRRRNWSKFWGGFQMLKRCVKGQLCRKHLRTKISIFLRDLQQQQQLEQSERKREFPFFGSNNAFNNHEIVTISSGSVVFSGTESMLFDASNSKYDEVDSISDNNSNKVSGDRKAISRMSRNSGNRNNISRKSSKQDNNMSNKGIVGQARDTQKIRLEDDSSKINNIHNDSLFFKGENEPIFDSSIVTGTASIESESLQLSPPKSALLSQTQSLPVLRPLHRSIRAVPPKVVPLSTSAHAATVSALVLATSDHYAVRSNLNPRGGLTEADSKTVNNNLKSPHNISITSVIDANSGAGNFSTNASVVGSIADDSLLDSAAGSPTKSNMKKQAQRDKRKRGTTCNVRSLSPLKTSSSSVKSIPLSLGGSNAETPSMSNNQVHSVDKNQSMVGKGDSSNLPSVVHTTAATTIGTTTSAASASLVSSNQKSLASSIAPLDDLHSRAQDGYAWFQRPVKYHGVPVKPSKQYQETQKQQLAAAFALTQISLPALQLDRQSQLEQQPQSSSPTASSVLSSTSLTLLPTINFTTKKIQPFPSSQSSTDASLLMVGPSTDSSSLLLYPHDIITQISINNIFNIYGSAVKWIPFAILPDAEIIRLLTCTVLSITSPSFCATDSKRLCRLVRIQRRSLDVWSRIHSLLIYGTRMGESGMAALMSLGTQSLKSLSIGYTLGLTHKVMSIFSQQLMHENTKLIKLYIEGEHICGDRGMVILFKHLQYNNTLQSLTIRDCGLSNRTAHACARYLSITQCLKTLNLNDNLFSLEDAVSILRAIANRGPKGTLELVSMQDQFPPLTAANVKAIYQYGTSLGVRVESKAELLDAIYATELEQARPEWMHDDVRSNHAIEMTVEEFRKDGTLLSLGQLNKYSKRLIL